MVYSLWDLQPTSTPTINTLLGANNNASSPLLPNTVKKVLEDIYNLLTTQIENQITDTTLWDVNDVARWLKLSPNIVKRSVIVRLDFPRAVTPCHQDAISTRRWFAKDIINWAKLNRTSIPKGRKSRGRPRVITV